MLLLPLLDYLPRFFRYTNFFFFFHFTLHFGSLLAIPQHNVADVDRSFLLYNPTLSVLSRRLCMLRDNVSTFYDHLTFFNQYFLYHARLLQVLVIACDNNHLVALADIILWFES